jgi:membrane protease YdiL (CAAX protease family)
MRLLPKTITTKLGLISNIHFWLFITVVNLIILAGYTVDGKFRHGIGYFVFFYIAISVIYALTKTTLIPVVVMPEARRELFWAVGLSVAGLMGLSIHFYCRAQGITIPIFLKLTMFVFSLPIPLAIYLFAKRYSFRELGFRFTPWRIWLVAVSVLALAGGIAYLANPEGILLQKAMSYGFVNFLLDGVVIAALSEEFLRFVLQTRLRGVINNPLTCIFVASVVWSLMHLPVALFQGGDAFSIARYLLQLVPLGFVWGYMTYCTGSFLPSVLAHGFNIWGLQNS